MIVQHLDYCTSFKAKGRQFLNMACFSQYFLQDLVSENPVEIYIVKDPNFGNECRVNHYLLFTEKEILEHLANLKRVIPSLKYTLTQRSINIFSRDKEYECYVVTIWLKDVALVHKYALTWIRYLYEYPYNLILKEAFRLKRFGHPFNRFTPANLYILCASLFPTMPGEGHSVSSNGYFISNKELIAKLHEVQYLNAIYHRVKNSAHLRLDVSYDDFTDTEYWDNPENFKKRVNHYKKLLRIFKYHKDA